MIEVKVRTILELAEGRANQLDVESKRAKLTEVIAKHWVKFCTKNERKVDLYTNLWNNADFWRKVESAEQDLALKRPFSDIQRAMRDAVTKERPSVTYPTYDFGTLSVLILPEQKKKQPQPSEAEPSTHDDVFNDGLKLKKLKNELSLDQSLPTPSDDIPLSGHCALNSVLHMFIYLLVLKCRQQFLDLSSFAMEPVLSLLMELYSRNGHVQNEVVEKLIYKAIMSLTNTVRSYEHISTHGSWLRNIFRCETVPSRERKCTVCGAVEDWNGEPGNLLLKEYINIKEKKETDLICELCGGRLKHTIKLNSSCVLIDCEYERQGNEGPLVQQFGVFFGEPLIIGQNIYNAKAAICTRHIRGCSRSMCVENGDDDNSHHSFLLTIAADDKHRIVCDANGNWDETEGGYLEPNIRFEIDYVVLIKEEEAKQGSKVNEESVWRRLANAVSRPVDHCVIQ